MSTQLEVCAVPTDRVKQQPADEIAVWFFVGATFAFVAAVFSFGTSPVLGIAGMALGAAGMALGVVQLRSELAARRRR